MKNTGGPVYPSVYSHEDHQGMSLRDYFAAAALQGLLANAADGSAVVGAYLFADAMLAERDK